jgi:hypothetical protein
VIMRADSEAFEAPYAGRRRPPRRRAATKRRTRTVCRNAERPPCCSRRSERPAPQWARAGCRARARCSSAMSFFQSDPPRTCAAAACRKTAERACAARRRPARAAPAAHHAPRFGQPAHNPTGRRRHGLLSSSRDGIAAIIPGTDIMGGKRSLDCQTLTAIVWSLKDGRGGHRGISRCSRNRRLPIEGATVSNPPTPCAGSARVVPGALAAAPTR